MPDPGKSRGSASIVMASLCILKNILMSAWRSYWQTQVLHSFMGQLGEC